jgi:tetratricopeptide (TPR) repeat protein
MEKIKKNLTLILCLLVAFVFGLKQLREPDIWWQLLAGKWMLQHGQVTHQDMFSYTMEGVRWINVKWLYEVIIAGIEKVLGPEGVILLQAVVNVGIILLLFHALKQFANKVFKTRASEFYALVAAVLFLIIVEYRMAGRPEMISHLMCVAFIAYLSTYPELKWKHLIVPAVLQCIWANMHEGYPIGVVLLGSYAVGSLGAYLISKNKEDLQTFICSGVLVLMAVVAILINPNGVQLWKQPFEIYRQVWVNKYTTELYAFYQPEYWTIQAKLHIALLAMVIIFWVIRILRVIKEKQPNYFTPLLVSYLIWIPLFGYLSLTANRNIPFAQIVLFPSVPLMFTWLMRTLKISTAGVYKTLSDKKVVLSVLIIAALYVSIVSDAYYKATQSANRYGVHVNMLHNPIGAANFIKEHKIKGPAFSDYFVSSYLLWDLYPSFKSYIDLRDLDIFSEKFFDDYFQMYKNPEEFYEADKKYNFNYVVLSTSQLPILQERLYWRDGYNLVYVDPVSVIFLKINEQNQAINGNIAIQKLFSWPTVETPEWAELITHLFNPSTSYTDEESYNAAIHSAKFYTQVRNYDLAIKQLMPEMSNLQGNAEAYAAMGNTYLQYAMVIPDEKIKSAKIDTARIFLEQALITDKSNNAARFSMASIELMQGNTASAVAHLEDYVRDNRTNDYAYYLLGLAYRQQWYSGQTDAIGKGKKAMQKAAKLNKENGNPYIYLAEIEAKDGNKDEARAYLKKALKHDEATRGAEEKKLVEMLKQQLGM